MEILRQYNSLSDVMPRHKKPVLPIHAPTPSKIRLNYHEILLTYSGLGTYTDEVKKIGGNEFKIVVVPFLS